MDRRILLKTLGALAAGALVPACASGGSGAGPPEGQPNLNVLSASYEKLVGPGQAVTFGVTTIDNQPVKGADLQVFLRDSDDETVLTGPVRASYHELEGLPLGVYLTTIDLPKPGPLFLVAVDGDRWGEAALNVVDPSQSKVAVPGAPAIVTPTPTAAAAAGVRDICTSTPPCGMHEVSLDTALRRNQPVALLFATPAFCQTAVCAPVVATMDEVRRSRDWGRVAFIHAEIYSDAGQTVAPSVERWGLPSEPWLFTIGPDGKIVDRLDGPMLPDEVANRIAAIA